MGTLFGWFAGLIWAGLALVLFFKLARCFRMVPNKRAYIIERLGKYHQTWGPGFHMLIPFLDKVAYIQDLREHAMDVPPQECFTKDNIRIEVDGVLYISVIRPENASYGITNYAWASVQLAQTTTRAVIGTLDLDRTFEERDAINSRVVSVLNEVSDAWGIQVHRYEVKNIVTPESIRNSMEQQMAAERERRALLARSEGEKMSRINNSEGTKAELINRSEGEKTRRINEAEGQAQEILAIARATAESIEKLGAAMSEEGGTEAIKLRLSQTFLSKLSSLARQDKQVLLPADLSKIDELLDGLGLNVPVPPQTPAGRPQPPAGQRMPPSRLPQGQMIG